MLNIHGQGMRDQERGEQEIDRGRIRIIERTPLFSPRSPFLSLFIPLLLSFPYRNNRARSFLFSLSLSPFYFGSGVQIIKGHISFNKKVVKEGRLMTKYTFVFMEQ